VPVRIKFYNLLPTGTNGTSTRSDETVMGSGLGRRCPAWPAPGSRRTAPPSTARNNTVWISDGNNPPVEQPADDFTPYPRA